MATIHLRDKKFNILHTFKDDYDSDAEAPEAVVWHGTAYHRYRTASNDPEFNYRELTTKVLD